MCHMHLIKTRVLNNLAIVNFEINMIYENRKVSVAQFVEFEILKLFD